MCSPCYLSIHLSAPDSTVCACIVQREVFELTGVLPPPLLPVVWMGHDVSCDNMHMYQVMADNGFDFASVCKSVNAVGVLDTYPLLWVRPSPLLFALSATRL